MDALPVLAVVVAVFALAVAAVTAAYARGFREGRAAVPRAEEGDLLVLASAAPMPYDEAVRFREEFTAAVKSGQRSVMVLDGVTPSVVLSAGWRQAVDVQQQGDDDLSTDVDSETGSGAASGIEGAAALGRVRAGGGAVAMHRSMGAALAASEGAQERKARRQASIDRALAAQEEASVDALYRAAQEAMDRQRVQEARDTPTVCTCVEMPSEGIKRDPNCAVHASRAHAVRRTDLDDDDARGREE